MLIYRTSVLEAIKALLEVRKKEKEDIVMNSQEGLSLRREIL